MGNFPYVAEADDVSSRACATKITSASGQALMAAIAPPGRGGQVGHVPGPRGHVRPPGEGERPEQVTSRLLRGLALRSWVTQGHLRVASNHACFIHATPSETEMAFPAAACPRIRSAQAGNLRTTDGQHAR